MKILIVSEVFRPGVGGVQTALDTLAWGLIAQGDEVSVITGSPKGIVRPYYEDYHGVNILRLPAIPFPTNPKNNRFSVFYKKAVREYFKVHKPDVIHFMTPYSTLYGLVARNAKEKGIPYVVTNHTMPANFEMNTRFGTLLGPFVRGYFAKTTSFMNTSSIVTAPTKAALDAAPGITVPSQAISNGVDTDFYCPGPANGSVLEKFSIDSEKKIITFTGRLDGEKRIDILIDAAKQILSFRSDIQLVIVGKGLLGDSLRARASPLGSNCVFTGFVTEEEKRELLRVSDVFVMPSPAELQCIAALEALATGVPVVVADQVALPELLDQGRNGVQFSYPSVGECAKAILGLLDGTQIDAMSTNARQWTVNNHSIGEIIGQYKSVYDQAVFGSTKS